MSTFFSDIKYAFRQLRKSPGFTVVAVISLSLGIGAATAIFSLVNAILLRSLPVPNPHELRVLQWSGIETNIKSLSGRLTDEGNHRTAAVVSHPMFLSLREQGAVQADIFGYAMVGGTARARSEAFTAKGMMVSDNFFSGLNVQPFTGRLFSAGEDYAGAATNIVITYDWWERHFSLDPDVLGQAVVLNGTSFTIIGVLSRGFTGVFPGEPPEFYLPMAAQSQFLHTSITADWHWFVYLMARLKPGYSEAQLQAALDVVFAREAGAVMKEPKILVEPGRSGLAYNRNNYRKPLLLMLGVVGLVMLVACANIAGLSLARGAARQHELAVRAALGAGRCRLIRQSLTESLVLTLLSGGLGILLAVWGRTAISRLLLAGSTRGLHYDFSLDLAVLGFSLAVALVTALLSGLLPALRAGRVDPIGGLKSRGALGAPRLRTGRVLVAAQICLSLLLLTGAGLYVRTLVNLTCLDVGFSTEKLLLFNLYPASAGYKNAQLADFYERVQNSLCAIPGVKGATLVQYPMLRGHLPWWVDFTFPGRPMNTSKMIVSDRQTVGETFFATLCIPVLHGRGLSAADTKDTPRVVVVNETFVQKYLPNEDPLGQTIHTFDGNSQIVGVCRDSKYGSIKEVVRPTMYFSFRQYSPRGAAFAVRTALPPLALATAVRKVVAVIDPDVPVAHITTQEAVRDKSISQERLFAMLCGALAGLALLLSCVGLYGLMAYHVARRTSEMAIRMAIGATGRQIAEPILRETLLVAAIGIGVGLPAVFAVTRLIKSQLYGVQPHDPVTLGVVIVMLVAVAVFAAWIPARRAAKIDPMEALRYE
jgi:predicted permease